MRMFSPARALTAAASILTLIASTAFLPATSVFAQTADAAKTAAREAARRVEKSAPRFNTQCNREAKAGTYACKFPGNLYSVSAFTKKKNPKRDDILALDRQVFMRSAQLALENDREYSTMTGERTSDTFKKGKKVYVPGTAGYSTAQQQVGYDNDGRPIFVPGQSVAGTPGYSYEKQGVAGRDALVKLWSTEEKALIDAGKLYRGVESDLFDAAGTYDRYRESTPGRWPTLIDLYEDRAERFQRIAAAGGLAAKAANVTVMKTYLRLAGAYTLAGRDDDASEALANSVKFLAAAKANR